MSQNTIDAGAPRREPRRSRRLFVFLPLAGFVGLAGFLGWGLRRNGQEIPSVLIGKPVPEFALPPVRGRKLGLSSADLKGQASLVNVFASWCTACREEHPILMQIKATGAAKIFGIDYKDPPKDAARWLDDMGDPYERTGADRDGRVAIDWGVYGVPETFVVTPQGTIAYKHIGAITPEVLRTTILPLLGRLQKQQQAPVENDSRGASTSSRQTD